MTRKVSRVCSIANAERLIVALDLPTGVEALRLVDQLGDTVKFYKVGLELFSSGDAVSLIHQLTARNKKVFADLKLYDVPETVKRAAKRIDDLGAEFLTVHSEPSVVEAATSVVDHVGILAVTVLTSIDKASLKSSGFSGDLDELVIHRSRIAHEAGCKGVIASGLEASLIKNRFENNLLIVTPGIRDQSSPGDDQKRKVNVTQAFQSGADYIVVGRPIRGAANPAEKAEAMQNEIHKCFAEAG